MKIITNPRSIPENLFQVRTINTNYEETKKDAEDYYKFLRKKGFKPSEIWVFKHQGLYEFHIFKTPHATKILREANVGEIY